MDMPVRIRLVSSLPGCSSTGPWGWTDPAPGVCCSWQQLAGRQKPRWCRSEDRRGGHRGPVASARLGAPPLHLPVVGLFTLSLFLNVAQKNRKKKILSSVTVGTSLWGGFSADPGDVGRVYALLQVSAVACQQKTTLFLKSRCPLFCLGKLSLCPFRIVPNVYRLCQ